MPRILLVRHGPSAHVHRDGWVSAAGMERWRAAYDEAGVGAQDPPPDLVEEAVRSAHFIASDLPRAVESAERLAAGSPVIVSPLLREIPLSIPRLPLRLPVGAWGAAITMAWGYRILTGTEATREDITRARTAARWLEGVASSHAASAGPDAFDAIRDSTTVVVTHGVFRRLLAKHLADAGWVLHPERRSLRRYRNWSAWALSAPSRTTRSSLPN
jgi:broad specificity phosphatase PhoE